MSGLRQHPHTVFFDLVCSKADPESAQFCSSANWESSCGPRQNQNISCPGIFLPALKSVFCGCLEGLRCEPHLPSFLFCFFVCLDPGWNEDEVFFILRDVLIHPPWWYKSPPALPLSCFQVHHASRLQQCHHPLTGKPSYARVSLGFRKNTGYLVLR